MKAAVYLGPKNLEIREVPTPEPKPGEVLVRVRSCSVCGTDVRIYNQGQKNVVPPRITGHEIAGVVSKIGRDVRGDLKEEGDAVQKVMDLTGGRGGDVVIAAAGVTTVMEQAIQVVAKRGRVSLFASVPKDNPWLKVDAKKFVSHRLPLEGIVDAIRNTQTGNGLKSVLEM